MLYFSTVKSVFLLAQKFTTDRSVALYMCMLCLFNCSVTTNLLTLNKCLFTRLPSLSCDCLDQSCCCSPVFTVHVIICQPINEPKGGHFVLGWNAKSCLYWCDDSTALIHQRLFFELIIFLSASDFFCYSERRRSLMGTNHLPTRAAPLASCFLTDHGVLCMFDRDKLTGTKLSPSSCTLQLFV